MFGVSLNNRLTSHETFLFLFLSAFQHKIPNSAPFSSLASPPLKYQPSWKTNLIYLPAALHVPVCFILSRISRRDLLALKQYEEPMLFSWFSMGDILKVSILFVLLSNPPQHTHQVSAFHFSLSVINKWQASWEDLMLRKRDGSTKSLNHSKGHFASGLWQTLHAHTPIHIHTFMSAWHVTCADGRTRHKSWCVWWNWVGD